MGRIQAGGDYAKLSKDEYEAILNALLATPTIMQR
jgi:hypothetical protein